MEPSITDRDMLTEVKAYLASSGQAEAFDADGIRDEIHAKYGLVKLDEVPQDNFAAILQRHAI